MRYLRTKLGTDRSPESLWLHLLKYPFRKWDPTHDYPYEEIHEWLIEFGQDGCPVREVGLDEHGQPVCARGFPDYGFWVGEDVRCDDFADGESISPDIFESAWAQMGRERALDGGKS